MIRFDGVKIGARESGQEELVGQTITTELTAVISKVRDLLKNVAQFEVGEVYPDD